MTMFKGSAAGGSGAPEPGVGNTLVFGPDSFDSYATWADMQAGGWGARRGNVPQFVAGRLGGQAVRFSYTELAGGDDQLLEIGFTETVDFYCRYWFRIEPGKLINMPNPTGSGMKWFMPWHAPQDPLRWTMGVGTLVGGPAGYTNSGWEFSGHDNQSPDQPNPFMQNINKSIRINTCNDGNWHKITYRLNNDPLGNASGVGGFHKIWVDDTLLADSSAGAPGVPPGGYTTGHRGIDLIQFPGLVTDGLSDPSHRFYIDIDDFVIWHT